MPSSNPTTCSSVAGAIFSEDRTSVLLIKRRDVPVWVLPGGGVELSESPEKAIEREVLEETGYIVGKIRLVGDYHPINRLAKRTQLFECFPKGKIDLAYNPECMAVRFFSLKNLPSLIPPPYQEWIEDAHSNKDPVKKKLCGITYPKLLGYFVSHPILVLRFLLARWHVPWNS